MLDRRRRLALTAHAGLRIDLDGDRRADLYRLLGFGPELDREIAYREEALRRQLGLRALSWHRKGSILADVFSDLYRRLVDETGLSAEEHGRLYAIGVSLRERRAVGFTTDTARWPWRLQGEQGAVQQWGALLARAVTSPALFAVSELAADAGVTVLPRTGRAVSDAVDVLPASTASDGTRRWTF